MADIGTVLGAAHTLLAALDCDILKEVFNVLGYKSQFKTLKTTVTTVQSVLLDAAASEQLTDTARDYIEKLKTAVYDADDLFDEFRTLAERKHNQLKKGIKFCEKVRLFFSSDNPLIVAFKLSREIKTIRKNLDGIARDHAKFGFAVVDSIRIKNRREETCSYVNAPTVIGREADVKAIVDKLLDLNGEKGTPFLTVVGIGGMGKTTLAQLVCSEESVKNGFSSNVWWVCVGDQDNNQFDKKAILCAILDLATDLKHHGLSLEEVQIKLRRELEGKKYLLVLDDLWNDVRVKWMEMKEFLMLGSTESRIMVTTRSHDVAKAIGNSDIHELKGLSDENSWRLFEETAFEQKPDSQVHALQLEIGRKIVKQCSNVPLAIKVVGSLLSGQGLDRWEAYEKSGLGGIRKGDNQIMSILKFSYHNLEPSLKSCFTYCALFPKDYVIKKDMLINLWMAQGYIVPFDEGQSVEKASEEHFVILLRRCFFQDVEMDKFGNVESFKMHDLMHDVAQEVSGQEILVATSETKNLGDKVRHVFEDSRVHDENFYSNMKVRSYLRVEHRYPTVVDMQLPLDRILTNGVCLRTLALVDDCLKMLPDSIGELLHLTYLDLSRNRQLEKLPSSITKLHNLQTLTLQGCERLRKLPNKFSRLVNLMHLDIKECDSIKYMPVGMDKLTSLRELTKFVVADESSSGEKRVGQLKDLKSLAVNLKGQIVIVMQKNFKRADVYDWEGSEFFEGAEHLQAILIGFPPESKDWFEIGHVANDDDVAREEALLKKLLPPRNVSEFGLVLYRGVKIPSWGRADCNWALRLPNLVTINITCCRMLKHLPSLSALKYLKSLTLNWLPELEYIDDTNCNTNFETSKGSVLLFPSLESLVIEDAPKLKGIWAGVEFSNISNNARLCQRSFPRLTKLGINGSQYWEDSSAEFQANICMVDILKSLPVGRLSKIRLGDEEVESLAQVGEVFKNCSSLQSLTLERCSKLSGLSGGLEHLTTLESLEILDCGKLKWEEEDDEEEDGMPWKHLHHNLRSVELTLLENLKRLPKGMQYMSSLQHFTLRRCDNLEALPDWISCLSSLQSLSIKYCTSLKSIPEAVQNMRSLQRLELYECSEELMGRCQEPDGQDWAYIKHIPNIVNSQFS